MMNMDDVEKMLNSGGETPSKDTVLEETNTNSSYNNYSNYNSYKPEHKKADYKGYNNYNKGGSNYNKSFNKSNNFKKSKPEPIKVEPIKIEPTKLVASSVKTFAIDLLSIPLDKHELVKKLCEHLFNKGFVYRSTLEGDSTLSEDQYNNTVEGNKLLDLKIRQLPNSKVDGFMPWKNYNFESTEKETIKNDEPTTLSFQYAHNYNKFFNEMSEGVKKLLGRQMYTFLGENLNNPTTVIFTYTKCGSSKIGKNFNYKEAKRAVTYLKVGNDINSSLFNLGSENVVSDFSTYLKSIL